MAQNLTENGKIDKILTENWHLHPPSPSRPSLYNSLVRLLTWWKKGSGQRNENVNCVEVGGTSKSNSEIELNPNKLSSIEFGDWIKSNTQSIVLHSIVFHDKGHNCPLGSSKTYCSVVWGNCAKTSSDKLQRLQNRAVRVLTNTRYDADANQLLKELGWDNLDTRRQKLKAEMVYKSLNGLAPNYLSSKFIQRSDVITVHNLRDSDGKLAIPLNRTNYCKNSFGYSGAVLWNSLPSAARQVTSLTSFRRLLINSDTAFM